MLPNEMSASELAPALIIFYFLICDCRGKADHSWSLPKTVSKERERLNITKSACGRDGKQFCSTLTLTAAQANHTGYYSCKYLSPAWRNKQAQSTIYIFIHGKTSIFYILLFIASSKVIKPPLTHWKGGFPRVGKKGPRREVQAWL